MKFLTACVLLLSVLLAQGQVTNVETLVCIRHGEKPAGGLGQLTCQGLNRALALPKVLLARYGKPDYVFAPNPVQKVDRGGTYNYIRPLMTIEPTAVQCGLPVNTEYGYKEIEALQEELQQPKYKSSVVFVAWEHVWLDKFAKALLTCDGGDAQQVKEWPSDDYDTIYVFKITHVGGHSYATLTIEKEGLNGLPSDCPK